MNQDRKTPRADTAPRRSPGRNIVRWSVIGGAIGMGPLMLYVIFGPADGNPIGLGLLAAASMPAALAGVIVGLLKMLAESRRGPS